MDNNPMPKCGWQAISATDLRLVGAEPGACERCGRSGLRFVHLMEHPDGAQMNVGCECAKILCQGYSPERAENRLRNLFARRSRWLTRNWATSRAGNDWLKFTHEGDTVCITVFPAQSDPSRWCASIKLEGPHKPFFLPGTYTTADAAKLAAFDDIADACKW